jgi:hypothetical protein
MTSDFTEPDFIFPELMRMLATARKKLTSTATITEFVRSAVLLGHVSVRFWRTWRLAHCEELFNERQDGRGAPAVARTCLFCLGRNRRCVWDRGSCVATHSWEEPCSGAGSTSW